MIRLLIIGLGAWLPLACTMPAMQVDPGLAVASAALPVAGRQGWLVRQQLRFGEYHSGPVRRGWTRGYDYPFIVRFTGASEKLEFRTTSTSTRAADAFCIGRLSEQDLALFRRHFAINLRTRDLFTCTVVLDGIGSYDFYAADLNQNRSSGEVAGALHGPGLAVSLRPVWRLQDGSRSWDTRPPGLEFLREGRVVGAVETVNDGRVWLDPGLPARERLVLAALASALLLRSDLEGHND